MTDFIKNCTGIILAGGENTRMPVPKAFIRSNGKPIIEQNLKIYNELFRESFIVTNQPEMYTHLSVPMLGDIYDIRGPMTGLFTALINSSAQWAFISACDMPFINKKLIKYMALQRNGYDAVIPRLKQGAEPLFAFYSKKLLVSIEKAVLSDRRGLRDFLRTKKVKYISDKEIRNLDPGARTFVNLNTPEDVKTHLHS